MAATLDRLEHLRVPESAELLHSLEQVRSAHETVAAAVHAATGAAGLDAPDADADLSTLIAAHAIAAEASDPVRRTTRRLREVALDGELADCAAALERTCAAADHGDPEAVDLVVGLVRLADAKAAGATLAELSALDSQLRPVLPNDLSSLLLGIMLGKVSLGAPASAPPSAIAESVSSRGAGSSETAAETDDAVEESEQTAVGVEDPGPAPVASNGCDEAATPPAESMAPSSVVQARDTAAPLAATVAMPVDASLVTTIANQGKAGVETAVPDDATVSDTLRHFVNAALDQHDTGLAYWLARAGADVHLADALRVATLAEALRSDDGPVADAAVSALEEFDPTALGRDRLAALTALAAALRTTIVTGSPDAGTVLELLGVQVSDYGGLHSVTQALATAAQRGALTGRQLESLRESGSMVAELATARRQAHEELSRSRTVLLQRATTMAAQLFAPHGTVGWLLTSVANDTRHALDRVRADLDLLENPSKVKRLIDDLDRDMRGTGSSGRPLQGKARQQLNKWIAAALEPVREWVRVVQLLQRGSGDRHLPGDLIAFKNEAASAMSSVRDELAGLAAGSADERSASVLLAAAADTIEMLLAGQPAVGSDGCDVDQVMGRALLRAPRIALDNRLIPLRDEDVTVETVAEALSADWPAVIRARAEVGDFATARQAIAVAAGGDPDREEQYKADLDKLLETRRARSVAWREELDRKIEKATWNGQLGDDDQIRFTTLLASSNPHEREDLNVVDEEFAAIEAQLPALADAARAEIAAHLQHLVDKQEVSVNQESRVKRLIELGEFASADEILAAVEAGQDLPEPVTLDVLDKFFPTVPDALSNGLTREVIAAVRNGADAAGCTFGELPEETRNANADALDAWRNAAVTDKRGRIGRVALATSLRLAGIEASGEAQLPTMIHGARSGDRRFVDLTGVRVVGNAIVPAFGSRLGGKLRLLLVWGPQTPQSIVNWVRQDASETPVLVCLFGVMSTDARRKLAVATAALTGKPVAVLDDAALTFLASRPESSITTTMQILLPFATINPYVPQAEGNVPTEMFYGRNHELVRLTGMTDSLVYGGRQLGKSALLRAAERRHEENEHGDAVYVSTQLPDTLWDALRTALDNKGIRAPGRERRDAYTSVTTAVNAWLESHPEKRLLVLVDECDNFFDLDAKENFTQTSRLRDLRNQTNGRFKPVFAGLHEVARFASLPNQPFAHLGKPLPIGPLAPAEAFRLVVQPLATLGVRFDDDMAAWRVLAYCNNQPILLQLVCQHLVNHVHRKRDEFSLVPYVITDDEFSQVWSSPALTDEVSGKLKLTLDLDQRYGVVARVLGLAALEKKAQAMSTVTLRGECVSWWPQGFAAITDDEFRALLIEMVTLGVLAQEGANWTLRSANVRRMLGASEDIETWLVRADQAPVPGPRVAGENRRALTGGRVAPLTETQLVDLVGRSNQLRIVLGSRATGADLIGELLERIESDLGKFELIQPRGKTSFLDQLAAGEAGSMHRVVYSNVTEVSSENVLHEIEEAQRRLPGDGVTRSAVLYLGIEQAEVWLELLGPGGGRLAADTVIACRRLDFIGLQRWSHEQQGQFSDLEERDRLLEMTGGWPLLIDSVAAACAAGIGTSEAMENLRRDLKGELGKELLASTGLTDSALTTSYDALVGLGADLLTRETESTFEEVLEGTSQPTAMLAALTAIGAVTRHEDDTLSLEPVLAALWHEHLGA